MRGVIDAIDVQFGSCPVIKKGLPMSGNVDPKCDDVEPLGNIAVGAITRT